MNIDSKELESVIEKYKGKVLVPLDDILSSLQDLITPKPTFVKGEIVVLQHGDLKYFNELMTTKYIRKLESLPLAPTSHNSPDRPEGLEDDDWIMVNAKSEDDNKFETVQVKTITFWECLDKYIKVHFVGGE